MRLLGSFRLHCLGAIATIQGLDLQPNSQAGGTMFHVYEASSADEIWRQIVTDLENPALTHLNTLAGGSQELHHVALSISAPRQRWIVSRAPAINPAFALAEVVWMIRGRRDAAFLTAWNSKLPKYSGSASQLHGAYGYRLQQHFGVNQLSRAAEVLSEVPHQRQVVLEIWDPNLDLPYPNGRPKDADIPCNVCSIVKVSDGHLEWLQVMRSNDVDRGLPYNIVQWTSIQEILAGWIGIEVGTYNHLSDSLHRYHANGGIFKCSDTAGHAENTDDIRLEYTRSLEVFAYLESFIEEVSKCDPLTLLAKAASLAVLPESYLNWARVFVVERLRREGEIALARTTVSQIDNNALRCITDLWLTRFEKRHG